MVPNKHESFIISGTPIVRCVASDHRVENDVTKLQYRKATSFPLCRRRVSILGAMSWCELTVFKAAKYSIVLHTERRSRSSCVAERPS
jgi:hypothetical protein